MKFLVIKDPSFYRKRRIQHLIVYLGIPLVPSLNLLIDLPEEFSTGVYLILAFVLLVLVGLILFQYFPKLKEYYFAKYLQSGPRLHISNHGFTLYDKDDKQRWNIPLDEILSIGFVLHGLYGLRFNDFRNNLIGCLPVNRLILQLNDEEKTIDLDFESHYQFVQFKKILEQLKNDGLDIEGRPGLRISEFKAKLV